jgi:hypothetical protein
LEESISLIRHIITLYHIGNGRGKLPSSEPLQLCRGNRNHLVGSPVKLFNQSK